MEKTRGLSFLIIASILTLSISISGCTRSEESQKNTDPTSQYISNSFQRSGDIQGTAQSAPQTISEEIHFEIPYSNIIRIRINVSIEDGDDNTGVDSVDSIRMWRETGGEPDSIERAPGGDTPFTTSIEFEYTGDEKEVNWWIVEITATINGGEDQWIGPIFWRGIEDTGIHFQIDSDFDYLEPVFEEDQ